MLPFFVSKLSLHENEWQRSDKTRRHVVRYCAARECAAPSIRVRACVTGACILYCKVDCLIEARKCVFSNDAHRLVEWHHAHLATVRLQGTERIPDTAQNPAVQPMND
jgi:hypothetical protein